MADCIFCTIVRGESPAKYIYKDDDVVVFRDINPKAPIHVLVLPRKHIASVREVSDEDKELLGKLFLVIRDVSEKLGIAKKGYKLVCNNGKAANQVVDHLHIHVLGGWQERDNWKV